MAAAATAAEEASAVAAIAPAPVWVSRQRGTSDRSADGNGAAVGAKKIVGGVAGPWPPPRPACAVGEVAPLRISSLAAGEPTPWGPPSRPRDVLCCYCRCCCRSLCSLVSCCGSCCSCAS